MGEREGKGKRVERGGGWEGESVPESLAPLSDQGKGKEGMGEGSQGTEGKGGNI